MSFVIEVQHSFMIHRDESSSDDEDDDDDVAQEGGVGGERELELLVLVRLKYST